MSLQAWGKGVFSFPLTKWPASVTAGVRAHAGRNYLSNWFIDHFFTESMNR